MTKLTAAHNAVGHFDADVAIVGYGPVGVAAANFLGSFGISTQIIERDEDIFPRARAVTVNDWTLRAFQAVGLDDLLKADMEVNGSLRWKTYAGREIFSLTPADNGIGHPPSVMIYQPVMEQTLRRGAERFSDVVDLHFGETVTGVAQDDTGVTLTVAGVADPESVRTVRARYVLACDGGSSTVRKELGVQLLGLTHETTWIIIDAEVLRWWPECNELVFWSDPDRPAVDIPLALGHHRWELPLRDSDQKSDFDKEDAIWDLLTPMGIGRDNVRLKNHAFYSHHVRHAETWQVGKVFLLGDSAHLMPPWAGQGMQSGIRDAQNIAWKLREVLAGRLGEEVLTTYEQERAPQVAAVTEQSQKMGELIASRDPKFIRVRNTLGPIIKRVPLLSRALIPQAAPAIDAGWIRGTAGKKTALGRMIPQPEMCTATGRRLRLDDALGDGFAVLGNGIDPRSIMTANEIAGWEALGAQFIAIQKADGIATSDHDLIDHTGTFLAWMSANNARVVGVRPDRFVAVADGTGLGTPTPASAALPGAVIPFAVRTHQSDGVAVTANS